MPSLHGNDYVAHLYVIQSEHRDSLREYLAKNNISSEVHFPISDVNQAAFNDMFEDRLPLDVTNYLCRRVLTLPCFPEMTDNEVSIIISIVNQWKP